MDTLFDPDGSTDVRRLLAAFAFFEEHPDGFVKVGVWPDDHWNAAQFRAWFTQRLMAKISFHEDRKGRKTTDEYQLALRLDAQAINDYSRRLVRPGCNILRTPEMKRRFPHIDHPAGDE